MIRLFDLIVSLLLLIILSPVMLITALLIRLKLGKPILFTQTRPGFKAKPFVIYKFRTLNDARDKTGNLLPDVDRFTAFGSFLRKYSLDELPQLYNVIKGDLSLVGPRPLLMEYVPLFNEQQSRRHDVPPGITGLAQINGRNAISWDEKFAYDLWYVAHRSLRLNLKILFLTCWQVVKPRGVNQSSQITMEPFKGNH